MVTHSNKIDVIAIGAQNVAKNLSPCRRQYGPITPLFNPEVVVQRATFSSGNLQMTEPVGASENPTAMGMPEPTPGGLPPAVAEPLSASENESNYTKPTPQQHPLMIHPSIQA